MIALVESQTENEKDWKIKELEGRLKKSERDLKKVKGESHFIRWFVFLSLVLILIILIWGITTHCTTTDYWTWTCPF